MAEAMFLLILPFLYQKLSSSTDFLYLLLCTNCLCLWILLYSRVLQAICIIPSLDSLSFVFQSLCTFLLSFVHCTTYFPSSGAVLIETVSPSHYLYSLTIRYYCETSRLVYTDPSQKSSLYRSNYTLPQK